MTSNNTNGNDCSDRIDNAEQITSDLLDALDAPDAVADQFTELVGCLTDTITEQDDEIDTLRDEKAELEDRVDELEAQPEVAVEDDTDPVGSFTVDGAPVGKVLKAKAHKSDVEHIETELDEITDDDMDTSPGIDTDDLTPIEQLARHDDPGDVIDSPSVERAVSLFQNLTDWGSKTPKGYALRPADNPLKLLEADQDANLAWNQYYRAAETLEQLSKGAITFFDSDKHGKMVVLHERSDVHDRVRSGSLTASLADEQGAA